MTLKDYMINQYHQGKHEILQAIDGLSDEQLRAMPNGHWPIAWVVQHLCMAMDYFIIYGNTGKLLNKMEQRFRDRPPQEPTPDDKYLGPEVLKKRWVEVIDRCIEIISELSDDTLHSPSRFENRIVGDMPMDEIIMLMEYHLNVHLRNIWTSIGLQGIDSKWADQFKSKYI